jgi:hypothetical protein
MNTFAGDALQKRETCFGRDLSGAGADSGPAESTRRHGISCISPRERSILIKLKRFMILTRRSVPVLGLSIACCCVAWAQLDGPGGPPPDGGPPPGEMQQQSRGPSVDRQLKRLTVLLTLTAYQQTQVKAILTDQRQQMLALFKQSSGGAATEDQPPSREAMESMRAEMKTVHAAAQAKIAALLTADQKVTFAAWQKKHARASAHQENDNTPPPPPDGQGGPPPDGGGGPGGAGPGGGGPPGV